MQRGKYWGRAVPGSSLCPGTYARRASEAPPRKPFRVPCPAPPCPAPHPTGQFQYSTTYWHFTRESNSWLDAEKWLLITSRETNYRLILKSFKPLVCYSSRTMHLLCQYPLKSNKTYDGEFWLYVRITIRLSSISFRGNKNVSFVSL